MHSTSCLKELIGFARASFLPTSKSSHSSSLILSSFLSPLWALLNAWAILNLGILQSRPLLFAAGFVTFYPKSHRTQLFPPELLPSSVAHYALLAALLLL